MNKQKLKKPVDFIGFPYLELEVRIPRRDLMQQVAEQLHIFSQAERARSAFKLSELGLMELQQLKTLVPFIIPPYQVTVMNGVICMQERNREIIELCSADEFTAAALYLFDGKKSITDISHRLAKTTTLTINQSDAYARGLFLILVSSGVCLPKNTRL
jgi:hypothetical protein